MDSPNQHPAPDSLLGLLQRGRGKGYLQILSAATAEAHGFLVECICNDPRLDRQVESRAEYYASIAKDVSLDLSPLARYLRDHDDKDMKTYETGLATETLASWPNGTMPIQPPYCLLTFQMEPVGTSH